MLMKMLLIAAVLATAAISNAADLPPSCSSRIYCQGELLHQVQTARLYNDSKTFVDFKMKNSENETLAKFDVLLEQTNRNPSKEQLREFVDDYFERGSELVNWTASDYTPDPKFLIKILDEKLRQFGKDVNDIWPKLGRKIAPEVLESPERYSLIPITHGFMIPGGRFTEIYYWDSYWIVEGLIICGMTETAKGMIENLMQLVEMYGHVPNGARVYYVQRSQPPLLTAMASLYMKATDDWDWLKKNIGILENELNYWLDTQTVDVTRNGERFTLLHYYSPSEGPRPESYYEDYEKGKSFDTEERRNQFYTDIKSAAESGWDFSSRWFIDENGTSNGSLLDIHTTRIIPVDLNSIFAGAMVTMADFQAVLRNRRSSQKWRLLAKYWKLAINQVLWNYEDGIWYDYDIKLEKHRHYFYPSNLAPLWARIVDGPLLKMRARRVVSYLNRSGSLDYPGGVPTSLSPTGEQWDLPNAWPPLVSIVVNALENLGTKKSRCIALDVAQKWIRANYKGYQDSQTMFEKYNVYAVGSTGDGGEYDAQQGFGWTNGVALEFLAKYGDRLTLEDTAGNELDCDLESKDAIADNEAEGSEHHEKRASEDFTVTKCNV